MPKNKQEYLEKESMRIKLYVDKILYKVYQKGFKQGQRQAEIQNSDPKTCFQMLQQMTKGESNV